MTANNVNETVKKCCSTIAAVYAVYMLVMLCITGYCTWKSMHNKNKVEE